MKLFRRLLYKTCMLGFIVSLIGLSPNISYAISCMDFRIDFSDPQMEGFYDTINSWPYSDSFIWPYPIAPYWSATSENSWPDAYVTEELYCGHHTMCIYCDPPDAIYWRVAEAGIPRESDREGLSLGELTIRLRDLTGVSVIDNWANQQLDNYLNENNITRLEGGSLVYYENLTDYVGPKIPDDFPLWSLSLLLACDAEIENPPDISAKLALFRSFAVNLEHVKSTEVENGTNVDVNDIVLTLNLEGWGGLDLWDAEVEVGCDTAWWSAWGFASSHISISFWTRIVIPFDVDIILKYRLKHKTLNNQLILSGKAEIVIPDSANQQDAIFESGYDLHGVDTMEEWLGLDDKAEDLIEEQIEEFRQDLTAEAIITYLRDLIDSHEEDISKYDFEATYDLPEGYAQSDINSKISTALESAYAGGFSLPDYSLPEVPEPDECSTNLTCIPNTSGGTWMIGPLTSCNLLENYNVPADVIVTNGACLKIDSGAVIDVDDNHSFIVEPGGSLHITNGTIR